VKKLEILRREFEKRQYPVALANCKAREAERLREEKLRFEKGEAYIPVSLASKVKTFEDYFKHCYNSSSYGVNENVFKFDYFVPYTLFGDSCYRKPVRSVKDSSGRHVRLFEQLPASEMPRWDKQADISDMWVKVTTNEDDTEIVEVDCGMKEQ
jgi:hypothetical protein